MSLFREIPPTAGWPIYIKDIIKLSFNYFLRKKKLIKLEDRLKEAFKVDYAWQTCSGTAALYIICQSIKKLSDKKTVIIPAYICPLVALAIKRAGLKVKVCDINENDFNYNLEKLSQLTNNDDVLAVIVNHLGGIVSDFSSVKAICKNRGILLIEDCAQALGALYQGQYVGTLGDISFFSFCRGKGLTIYEGGMIITNQDEYAKLIEESLEKIVKVNNYEENLKIGEIFGYSLFYRPFLFWWIFKLPSLYWRLRGQPLKAWIEEFDLDFPVHKVSDFRACLGGQLWSDWQEYYNDQEDKAKFYIDNLQGLSDVDIIQASEDSQATYPYLTVIFNDLNKRQGVFKALDKLGLGVSQIYACAIEDYDYLKDIVESSPNLNAKNIAQRSLTLSTSIFLTKKDLQTIVEVVKKITAS